MKQKFILTIVFYAGVVSVLVFNFQNCSQKFGSAGNTLSRELNSSSTNSQASTSQSAQESAGSSEDQPVESEKSGDSNNPPDENNEGVNSTLSPQECYVNYISIFKWENASASDAFNLAPILSVQKIATLKIFNGNQVSNTTLRTSLEFTNDTEWKYYFILSTGATPGSTAVTSYLNKKNQLDGSTELTCGFGPFFDANFNITDPSARIVYQNVGVGFNGIDGQVGFLSHKDKFIVCKITKGSQGVRFHGDNSEVSVNQAFVIKRGCYGQN